METKRIFVTGATGFIGRHLVKELVEQGHIVTCLVRNPEKETNFAHNELSSVAGDLRSFKKWGERVKGHDVVFHLAAIRGEFKIPWETYYTVNVEATRKLIETSTRCGVSDFFYISSVGVHGTTPLQTPANELTPYNPDSYYHKSKMLAEQTVLEWVNSLNITVIRPTITYGPNDVGFLYRVAKIARNGFFPIVGHGENKVHILHVKGLVQTLVGALGNSRASGQTYVIADKSPIKLRDLVQLVGNSIHEQVRFINIPFEPFLKLSEIYDDFIAPIIKGKSMMISLKLLSLPWYYSIGKAVGELQYHPHQTEEAVKGTMQWYVNNGWL